MRGHEEGISLPEILVATFLIGLILVPLVQILPGSLGSNITTVDVALSAAAMRKMEEVITILRAPQVTFNTSTSAQTTSPSLSSSNAITIDPSANYALVLIGISDIVASSSVSVGLSAATLLVADTDGTYRVELWGMVNPPTGTQTVTVLFPSPVGHSWVAASYKGVLSATPVGISNSAFGTSAAPSVPMSPRTANSLLVGGFLMTPPGATISQGQVAIATATTSGSAPAQEVSTHLAMEVNPGGAGTAMRWSLSAAAIVIAAAVELRGVATTGTTSGTSPCADLPRCLLVWTTTTVISSTVPGGGSLNDLSVVACLDLNGNNACEPNEPQVRYDSKITTHP